MPWEEVTTEFVITDAVFDSLAKSPSKLIISLSQMGGMTASGFDRQDLHNPGSFVTETIPHEVSSCDIVEPHAHFLSTHDGQTRIQHEEMLEDMVRDSVEWELKKSS